MQKIIISLFMFLTLPIANALACTNPAGSEGDIIYNSTAKMLQFCNGSVWVNASGVAPSSGGGGGAPTYMGLSSSSNNGDVSNQLAGLEPCVTQHIRAAVPCAHQTINLSQERSSQMVGLTATMRNILPVADGCVAI